MNPLLDALVATAQELHRLAGDQASSIKVTVWMPDPYTKAMVTEKLIADLRKLIPPHLKENPDSVLLTDELNLCGLTFEFREPDHPTQMEEITDDG